MIPSSRGQLQSTATWSMKIEASGPTARNASFYPIQVEAEISKVSIARLLQRGQGRRQYHKDDCCKQALVLKKSG
jgi:hypothetical protein